MLLLTGLWASLKSHCPQCRHQTTLSKACLNFPPRLIVKRKRSSPAARLNVVYRYRDQCSNSGSRPSFSICEIVIPCHRTVPLGLGSQQHQCNLLKGSRDCRGRLRSCAVRASLARLRVANHKTYSSMRLEEDPRRCCSWTCWSGFELGL